MWRLNSAFLTFHSSFPPCFGNFRDGIDCGNFADEIFEPREMRKKREKKRSSWVVARKHIRRRSEKRTVMNVNE
jgi:hypothetical protein